MLLVELHRICAIYAVIKCLNFSLFEMFPIPPPILAGEIAKEYTRRRREHSWKKLQCGRPIVFSFSKCFRIFRESSEVLAVSLAQSIFFSRGPDHIVP